MTRPARTLRDAARDLTLMSDDGSEYEHNDGCQGEANCPACWVEGIRQLFIDFPDDAVVKAEARQQTAQSIRDEAVDEAVDGWLPLTTVIRICEETGR